VSHAATHRLQQTLAGPVTLHGPGLFHGIDAHLNLLPADADHGIVFCRTDLPQSPTVPARHDYVINAPRRTVLGQASTPLVETIEHVMAALTALGVDNCRLEIDAPEVPSFDGSSRVFCDAILDTGLQHLSTPINPYQVTHTNAQQGSGGQMLVMRPYMKPLMAVTWQLDYGARAVIPAQVCSIEVTPETFVRDIASARTFVLESEITQLKSMGFGKHLTDRDLLVCGDDGRWNNPLRWQDECVRHKILDCIGDLALSGVPIEGHIRAARSGHKLNHQLAASIAHSATGNTQRARTA